MSQSPGIPKRENPGIWNPSILEAQTLEYQRLRTSSQLKTGRADSNLRTSSQLKTGPADSKES